MFQKITREPLVHFLFAGFLLFVYFKSCSTNSGAENEIVIQKEDLLNFMQYQSKAFNQTVFEDKWAQLSQKEKQQLIQRYGQEEVLYREAVKLGLDQNDFVIKRRIIQKMEFLLDDFDESAMTISKDSLQAYFQQHQQRYTQAPQYTFTHIFFKKEAQSDALKRAEDFLKIGIHRQLSATESLPYGDRFLYHRNYAEKTDDFIASQFGEVFTSALRAMSADKNKWQGPIASEHGQHLVKLLDKTEAVTPDLAEIHALVKADYLAYLKKQHKENQIQKLVDTYAIEVDLRL